MKIKLLFLMLFAITSLTSCREDYDADVIEKTPEAMFNFSASLPVAKNQTKTVNISRYIVEIYKTSDPTTIVKRVEQVGSMIVVSLLSNTNYTCLFWADEVTVDDNTNGTFNALDLKNVTLNTGKTMTDAFFARLDITDATTAFDVTLKRASAQVNIVTTGTVAANTDLTITYNQYRHFNAFASEVAGTTISSSKTFNSIATTGVLGTFLTFASVSGILSDFISLYNSSITNEIKNTPLKANYITNIRGNYADGSMIFTVVITVDEVWESVIPGIQINVGTLASPKWIIVADRNAEKGGTHGATAGNSASDYGYYYQGSNATNDADNVEKGYRACFDFGEGNGLWRLPTKVEWTLIVGTSGSPHAVDANRKLKWNGGPAWKLYDERIGQTTSFVYLPMGGLLSGTSGASTIESLGVTGYYWSSTISNGTWYTYFMNNGYGGMHADGGIDGSSVRCVRDI